MAVDREPAEQVLREHALPAEAGDHVVDGLDLAGGDVVGELRAGVALERVRRVAGLQVGGQLRLGVGTGTTGDSQVDELVVRVLGVEDLDQSVKAELLGTGGPPGEHADVATGATGRTRRGTAGSGTLRRGAAALGSRRAALRSRARLRCARRRRGRTGGGTAAGGGVIAGTTGGQQQAGCRESGDKGGSTHSLPPKDGIGVLTALPASRQTTTALEGPAAAAGWGERTSPDTPRRWMTPAL